jgi:hypothetical protein
MKCPNRPIKTIKTEECPDFCYGKHKKTTTIKTDFGECIGHECPYFCIKTSYNVSGSYIEKAACRLVNENG